MGSRAGFASDGDRREDLGPCSSAQSLAASLGICPLKASLVGDEGARPYLDGGSACSLLGQGLVVYCGAVRVQRSPRRIRQVVIETGKLGDAKRSTRQRGGDYMLNS